MRAGNEIAGLAAHPAQFTHIEITVDHKHSDKPVIVVLAAVIVVYAIAPAFGLTQHLELSEVDGRASRRTCGRSSPFRCCLAAIAVLPLLEGAAHWWERNLNKFYVAANLALVTLLYLAFLHPSGGLGFATHTLLHTVINEYIPFIVLLFSLYTISGGIRIAGDLPAHPLTNLAFLAVGALLASFIGTTGAAMLLVRPLLETNRERKHVAHTMVFFIFIVCNCGGLLLPLGDPPLFLGYLNGVDFLWTLNLWKSWLFVNGMLLAVYFVWDHFYAYPRETDGRHAHRRNARARAEICRHVAQRAVAVGRDPGGGAVGSGQAVSGNSLAPLVLSARDGDAGAGAGVADLGTASRPAGQLVRLSGDHRSGDAVHRHFRQHEAGAADPGAARRRVRPRLAGQIFLGLGLAVVGARQCADLPGLFRGGPGRDGESLDRQRARWPTWRCRCSRA